MLPASAARLLRMLYTEPVCAPFRSCAMPRRPASNEFAHPTHLWVGLLILQVQPVNFGVPGSPILGNFKWPRGQSHFWLNFEAQQHDFGGLVRFSGAFGPTTGFPWPKNLGKGPPFALIFRVASAGFKFGQTVRFQQVPIFRRPAFGPRSPFLGQIPPEGPCNCGLPGIDAHFSNLPAKAPRPPLLGNLRSCRSAIAPCWCHFERHPVLNPLLVPPKKRPLSKWQIQGLYAKLV